VSRALDDVGVPVFDALHAPLLIDSYPLKRKVIGGPLAAEMLAGVKLHDVVGLGILPGPLRSRSQRRRSSVPPTRTASLSRSRALASPKRRCRALGGRCPNVASGAPVDGYDAVEQQVSTIAPG
jgi:hypothetical protein